MVSADRLPAVNRLAATLPARFPVVNCLAVGSALDFGCRLPLQRLLFVRFPVVNRFAAVSAPDFWLPIAFAATLPVRFPVVCRLVAVSGCQSFCCGFRLLDSAARFPAVNCLAAVSAPDFWLSIAFAAISAARFWLHGFRGLPYRFCRAAATPAVPVRSRQPPCGSRFSGRRAPEFRP